jgi:uncharacterized protein YyaL (SSP411 family)
MIIVVLNQLIVMHPYTNRLVHETSPYLLQHAHNPVDWYPWGKEAFEKAKKEDKPVLVSIGYSACHWCHVMERESFEDAQVAALMNENFVNIKVDREERPDVDHIYMDAVQAITGSGGWPLNVFITPEGKPFYGGTYYPPKRALNRASWVEVLQAIAEAYREKKEEIEEQADNLTEHLKTTNTIGNNSEEYVFDKKNIELAYQNIMKTADKEWGGFGRAPKFPQTFTINFLLRYSILTGNKEALHQALLSLNKMIQGGIYDQLGGGFARYSTDTEWLAPHFEKMLYDNALLICTLSEGYQITKKERYKEIIEETLTFVERELMHKQGGFYSALDADSEGEEGKFYVWEYQEIEKLLGKNAFIFSQYYNVRREGNWEGKNILHTTAPLKEFSGNENIDFEDLKRIIDEGKTVLLKERNKRIRPGLDDKLLLSWNALMNSAYSKAYAATGNEHYKEVAIKNMNFLLSAFSSGKNQLFHSWKNEQGRHQAFLEDYSFLIAALIDLSEISTDTQWLEKAKGLTIYVTENFSDNETALLFYTQISQTDILLRKKEVYDSAIPSGNSVMALNFYRMGIIYDNEEWRQRATQMVSSFANMAVKYPTSFGVWLSMVFQISFGTNEIAIVGSEFQPYLNEVLKLYIPHSIIMASGTENNFPLLKGKSSNFHTSIYLCRNYACQQPLNSVKEFENMVSSNFFPKHTIFE